MNKKIIAGFFMMALCLSLPVNAASKTGKPLQDFVNQLKTFSADFEQIQPEEELFENNAAYGSFKLKRPGRLQWIYTRPDPQDILIDGVNLWVFDRDLDQVTVRDVADIQNDLPLSWLLFDEPIEKRYDIIYGGLNNGMEWFNLRPKEATYFESLDVAMQDGKMVEVHMYQSADNITQVRFKNIEVNGEIPEHNFQFQIPPDVDVIGQPKKAY